MATVFLNGEFVSRDDARISAFDAGLQHGVGLFETMLAIRQPLESRGVRVLLLRDHIERLAASARALGLTDSLRIGALEEAVIRTAERATDDLASTDRFRIRLTLTGGDLNMLERDGAAAQEPTLMIVASPAAAYPDAMFEQGVGVVLADYKANPLDPFAGHKTLNYWARLRELQRAAANRAGEALVFQVTNYLAGGCVSNTLLVRAGEIITPIAQGEEQDVARAGAGGSSGAIDDEGGLESDAAASTYGAVVPSPVLPGVTRAWALDWAEYAGLEVVKRMVTISDVLSADEVILTNSSWGALPVVRVEREAIGDAVVGPIAKRMREAWMGLGD
jgi:branched-subunit amino acid aminotransferase/4-amino-4-deoxychorismate lyase